jgi:hypothetical protein
MGSQASAVTEFDATLGSGDALGAGPELFEVQSTLPEVAVHAPPCHDYDA